MSRDDFDGCDSPSVSGDDRKERRRTHSINSAFSRLRSHIPNVPRDTKLSKIKTLRLAIAYISYLQDVLTSGKPCVISDGCGSGISDEEDEKNDPSLHRLARGRTGWPHQVWASEFASDLCLNKSSDNPP
ncbi:heart- and neural crest derivatives-expressed protein 2 [Galendromus occidentalis]|uniref:Heart- and neural crest derivatives-expressed protein 2 n=1 Tax=Galendromus occidentalis TaxID=34638 RepID=A0AAJ6QSC3_9ACAR|nr:heart- and neural crest derivatives-expressed protein 2 [Galendromus occidentalis]